MIWLLPVILLLAACTSTPTPFETGKEVSPLPGCIEYRTRGGEC